MENTIKNLFEFEIPKLWNVDDESDILYFLNEIATYAYIVEDSDERYDKYIRALDGLIDVILYKN